MRAVIQRCTSASVTVSSTQVSSIGRGLMVLVGIGTSDTPQDLSWLVGKILGLRLFPNEDPESSWKRSVVETGGEVLCVSQFTLMATSKKNKPDFREAMTAEQSKSMYEDFLSEMKKQYAPEKIQDGQFGAMMDVSLTNDGPVTILLDSREGGVAAGGPGSEDDAKKKRKEEWDLKAKANAQKARAASAAKKITADGERLGERFKEARMESA